MKTQNIKVPMLLLLIWGAGIVWLGGWARTENSEKSIFGILFLSATKNSYSLERSFRDLQTDCKFEIKLLKSRVKVGEGFKLQITVENRVNKSVCPEMTEIQRHNFDFKVND